MELNKIEVLSEFKQFQIREITDSGKYHRRVLTPDMDVSGEHEQIQEQAENLWTNEVKEKWSEKLEADNQHDIAAKKLIDKFGTSDEKKEIDDINARHRKTGYISGPDFKRRTQISNKYFSRLK